MICDRAFAADGSFPYPALDPTLQGGRASRTPTWTASSATSILVNGAPWPVLEVDAARYRLRILNASNARRYELALDPPRTTPASSRSAPTGDCSPRRSRTDSLGIAPAERFDVVVDFCGVPVGTEVTLVNRLGAGRTAHVMRFRVARERDRRQPRCPSDSPT